MGKGQEMKGHSRATYHYEVLFKTAGDGGQEEGRREDGTQGQERQAEIQAEQEGKVNRTQLPRILLSFLSLSCPSCSLPSH